MSSVSREIRALMDTADAAGRAALDRRGLPRPLRHRDACTARAPAEVLARFAREVEEQIGVTISVGLSHNKFLAKIASDLDKPRGFAVIGEAETLDFLADKPVSLIYGVGKVFAETLRKDGCETIGQLQRAPPEDLMRRYGETGARLAQALARRGSAAGQYRRRDEDDLGRDHLQHRPRDFRGALHRAAGAVRAARRSGSKPKPSSATRSRSSSNPPASRSGPGPPSDAARRSWPAFSTKPARSSWPARSTAPPSA